MKKTHMSQSAAGNRQTRREFARKLTIAGAGLPLAGSILPVNAGIVSNGKNKRSGGDPWSVNLFSKHLQFLDYDEMAEACAASGLDGVDLSVRPGGHVLPENVERDLPRAAKAIKKAGLKLHLMTSGITDPDDPVTEKILRVASEQGIRYYRLGYYRYDLKLGVEKSLENIKKKMSKLAVLNEKYRIHGAYQNHAGNRFGGPVWDIWYVIRDLDPRWTGCQYDIRHAIVEGAQSWTLGYELLKEHIRYIVIKDFEWSKKDGKWYTKNVPVGEGMVDFDAFFQKLEAHQFSGPISLHIEFPIYPDENMTLKEKTAAAIKTVRKEVQSTRALLPRS